ncbi:basic secretory family protein [Parachryseolinea silvisoli]|uniref:basic secretory family protein n=1 Tax=Parachryseolinea silvisoli TaxID=2873601 RepID=UPI002265AFE6|nr:basic secretory family protein [Parachryseolinea silvisoli]MCD9020031.1 basic secretory family protein [Parachryseolinea silvisoli]
MPSFCNMLKGFLAGVCLGASVCGFSQEHPDVYHRNGFTLIFECEDSTLDVKVKDRMIETFFQVYAVLTAQYNPLAERQVNFHIDTAYTGVAEAGGAHVRFSSRWLHAYPEDIDVVTHEVMHVAQAYPWERCPAWLTEGIADYARYKYGVDNSGAGWSLPSYRIGQHYMQGYRVAARFLVWMEERIQPGIVYVLHRKLQMGIYQDALWQEQTGYTLDELWGRYTGEAAEMSVQR